jgi:hypothetical protein
VLRWALLTLTYFRIELKFYLFITYFIKELNKVVKCPRTGPFNRLKPNCKALCTREGLHTVVAGTVQGALQAEHSEVAQAHHPAQLWAIITWAKCPRGKSGADLARHGSKTGFNRFHRKQRKSVQI